MDYDYLDHEGATADFCRDVEAVCRESAGTIGLAFDTEFVSEDRYRPELCLVQLAAGPRRAVIDTLAVGEMAFFWEWLAAFPYEVIVHSGREEYLFGYRSVGHCAAHWIDVQIAAGMVGHEFPSSYGNLLSRLLDERLSKAETRTDWRKRPLGRDQIEYALLDVVHLQALRDRLFEQLRELGRHDWLHEEIAAWRAQLEATDQQERWRRVSGISGLSPKCLAIVRELWRWREDEARRRDCPAKWVLRDDLVVELARRCSADPNKIRSVRGMQKRSARKIQPIQEAIERALKMPPDQWPRGGRRPKRNQFQVLGQVLAVALNHTCREANIAPSLVGTTQDIRDFLQDHFFPGDDGGEPPSLMRGWRGEIVGRLLHDLVDGIHVLRVVDPLSDQPLAIEPANDRKPDA